MLTALLTLAFFAGLCLVSYGAWLTFEPLGFIVAGIALVLIPLRYTKAAR